MTQIPEELIEVMMQMTGESRQNVEHMISASLAEMMHKPVFAGQSPSGRNRNAKKAKFTETEYPHFLPRTNVMKYTLRIVLQGLKLSVWRKIDVPSNITLRHLSDLLVPLMGWENEHLNQFKQTINRFDRYYAPFYQRDEELNDFGWGRRENLNQEEFTISDLLTEKGKHITWEYDFGDSWEHTVTLSSVSDYAEDEEHKIRFVGGKNACPPEDSGGVWGYAELLELWEKHKARKRLSAEDKERLEWYGMGDDFNPAELDTEGLRELCDEFND